MMPQKVGPWLFMLSLLLTIFIMRPDAYAAGSLNIFEGFLKQAQKYDGRVFYAVHISGIPVGVVGVGRRDNSEKEPFWFEFLLNARIGSSPLVAIFRERILLKNSQIPVMGEIQIFNDREKIAETPIVWTMNNEQLLSKELKLDLIRAIFVKETHVGNNFWNPESPLGIIFFKEGKPFLKGNKVDSEFETDGFLKSGSFKWVGDLDFDFKRVSEQEAKFLFDDTQNNPVDLAFFSKTQDQSLSMQELLRVSREALKASQQFEVFLVKHMPEVPYILHRKVLNLLNLSYRLNNFLSDAQKNSKDVFAQIAGLNPILKMTLSEDLRELPTSLHENSEFQILRDETKKQLWPKVISHLLQEAQKEIAQIVAIEENRKAEVSLGVYLDKLARRSILSTSLSLKKSGFNISFITPIVSKMDPQSLTEFPTTAKEFRFIHGQSLADGRFKSDFSALCQAFGGRIGLDLGHARPQFFRSYFAFGAWDVYTRRQLVTIFLRYVAATPQCQQVTFRVPKKLLPAIQSTVDQFRKSVLQVDTKFQIFNGYSKRLRLLPGTYDLIANSVINGAVLGKDTLEVAPADERGRIRHFKVRFK